VGSFPYPDEDGLRRDRQMTETRETVEKLKLELQEVRAAAGAQGSTVEASAAETQDSQPAPSGRARGRAARAAAGGGGSGQLSFDLAGLGLKEADRTQLAAAVQTTRSIIMEHI
jgi:type IV secretion system protein VirD4